MSFYASSKRVFRSTFVISALTTTSLLLFEGCKKTPGAEEDLSSISPGLLGNSHLSFISVVIAILAGALFGAFFSDKCRKYHKYIWLAMMALFAVIAVISGGFFAYVVWFIVGFVTAYKLLKEAKEAAKQVKLTTFGSAEWASLADVDRLKNEKILGSDGLFLGLFDDGAAMTPLYYRVSLNKRHKTLIGFCPTGMPPGA